MVPATVAVALAVPTTVPSGVAVLVATGVLPAQPTVQASQQLGQLLMWALPPRGARHLSAPFFTAHVILPLAVVRQQAT
jgi:hypothetical protein